MASLIDRMRQATQATEAPLPPAGRAAAQQDSLPPPAANLPPNLPPADPCGSCGRRLFWLTAYNTIVCYQCAPPSNPALVRRLLAADPRQPGVWLEGENFLDEEISEQQNKIEQQEIEQQKNFPPPKICGTCESNFFWMDYEGKIFCQHCQPPISSPAKILYVGLSPAGDLSWGDFSRPKFFTVREACQAWEIEYFDRMKIEAAERAATVTNDPTVAVTAAWSGKAGSRTKSRGRRR